MRRADLILAILLPAVLLVGCTNTPVTQVYEDAPTNESIKADLKVTPETVPPNPPAGCPVTLPGKLLFEPPKPFPHTPSWPNFFWFGSEHLWTILPTEGGWADLPLNPEGYTQKILWWSDRFSLKDEPQPDLVVSGQRLDAEAPPLKTYGATNAFAADIGEAMLTGVDFPTHGCWEVTGQYKKAKLSFVVWIAP